ncbi:uncharacterized protein LOC130776576 [Actinidia eriantha]|uniref:uncharacterized protein LOC130776576 n=1 Tax=Actinidia eriantha TaxID=165200 RepID=UPI00258ED20E|nr:uncharacterized protein LOC130776576 [Actinidia eriantha]
MEGRGGRCKRREILGEGVTAAAEGERWRMAGDGGKTMEEVVIPPPFFISPLIFLQASHNGGIHYFVQIELPNLPFPSRISYTTSHEILRSLKRKVESSRGFQP